eukprot:scaffold17082_cov150-Skeletonema_dohrnii-CCMP3373.AAC.6
MPSPNTCVRNSVDRAKDASRRRIAEIAKMNFVEEFIIIAAVIHEIGCTTTPTPTNTISTPMQRKLSLSSLAQLAFR